MSNDAHTPAGQDASDIYAEHLARVQYDDLPDNCIKAVKASILDTLACIYAGTSSPDVKETMAAAKNWGGKPTSTLIGAGGVKVSPVNAVLANGSAIHQDDFDDCHDNAPSHPTSASLVPALAVAEEMGGVSGKDLILAVALSNDLTCRLSKSITGRIFDHPWFRAPVCGLFGATAAAAKIRKATAAQHRHALGLALPLVGGTWASIHHHDSSVRAIRDGLNYHNGIIAAELAMRGLRGDPEVFEGPYGFFKAYYNGEFRREDVIGDLGKHFESAYVSLKPWPSMRNLHNMVTSVLQVMDRNKLSFEQIAKVEMEVGKINLTRCRPVKLGSVPSHRIDLLSNLHYAVAGAIRHGNIPLALFHDGKVSDDVIIHAMPKVTWKYAERQDTASSFENGRCEITTTGGQVFKGECMAALGHPENPMTVEQRKNKFLDCSKLAVNPPSEAQCLKIIDMVESLDNLKDIGELTRLLA
jgi:2-methylcitrate dehydratase PrpD